MGYHEIPVRQPKQPLVRFMHEWALTIEVEDELEPLTVVEASRSVHWREAMEREYKSLVDNNTWELVPLLSNRTVVNCKWCYWVETNARRTVLQHKARYMARGFTQRPGIDFIETTSPVVALTSLKALLAVATEQDMEIKQLDDDSAFLYRNLDKEIYLKETKRFQVDGTNGENLSMT